MNESMKFNVPVLFDSCPSTNDAAREGNFRHGDVLLAREQSAGRGQQGNRWESEPGANLTLSAVLEPEFLPAARQFELLQAVSLAVADALEGVDRVAIKWPNDIYADDRKIAGILMENDIMGDRVARSIVGIGLNVNQTRFPNHLSNPTSIALERGGAVDAREVLAALLDSLARRYSRLERGQTGALSADYRARLYLLDRPARYALPGGERFTGVIRSVSPQGALQVERADDGRRDEFLFKQIEFMGKG